MQAGGHLVDEQDDIDVDCFIRIIISVGLNYIDDEVKIAKPAN